MLGKLLFRQPGRYVKVLPRYIRQHTRRSPGLQMVKPPLPPNETNTSSQSSGHGVQTTSEALAYTKPEENSLLSPVHIPEDPNAVLRGNHPAALLLGNSGIVVQRQLEMMNVFIGFEQANKYVIMDPQGNTIGYMAEQERGMANVMARQWFRTHRSFTTHVFDKNRVEVLRFVRPFSYISSRIRVFDPLAPDDGVRSSSKSLATTESGSLQTQNDPFAGQMSSLPVEDMRIIGEAHQQWAPLRRKYNLFLRDNSTGADARINIAQGTISDGRESAKNQLQMIRSEDSGGYRQFAYVDEPFLSWDFSLRAADSTLLGSVNRNFAGFAREIFTDTGVYALRMDAASPSEASQDMIPQTGNARANAQIYAQSGMTLDKRAVMLATAVSLDFDYFSRHSGAAGPGFMPLWFPGMGSSAGEAEGAAEAGSEAGSEPGNAGNAGSQAGGDAGFEPEAEESGEDGDFWSGESMNGGSGGEKDWWNIFDDE